MLSLASAAALYHGVASGTFYRKIYRVGRPTPIKLNQLMKKGVNFAKEWTDEHFHPERKSTYCFYAHMHACPTNVTETRLGVGRVS